MPGADRVDTLPRHSSICSAVHPLANYDREDENPSNAIVSCYVKGSLIALDFTLPLSSAATLDDLMRELWRRGGQTGASVPEGGVEAIAGEL